MITRMDITMSQCPLTTDLMRVACVKCRNVHATSPILIFFLALLATFLLKVHFT